MPDDSFEDIQGKELTYPINDFSGAVQGRTTEFLRKNNQVKNSTNVDYSKTIGGAGKKLGYAQQGSDLTSTTSTSTSTSTTTTSTSTSSSTSTSTSTSTTTS